MKATPQSSTATPRTERRPLLRRNLLLVVSYLAVLLLIAGAYA